MSYFVDNDSYAEERKMEENVAVAEKKDKKELFGFWTVSGESYKIKLCTPEITELEKIYKCNLMSLMGDADKLPSLTTMLQVTHAAMKRWTHGIKIKDVETLYDKYIQTGGSMLQFYVDVYMRIYSVSGFFSPSMAADMDEAVEKLSESM